MTTDGRKEDHSRDNAKQGTIQTAPVLTGDIFIENQDLPQNTPRARSGYPDTFSFLRV
jgi:hypothetical protein